MNDEILKEISHELDYSLGGINLNIEKLKALRTEMGHVAEKVENTDHSDMTSMSLQFRDMSHKIIMIESLLNYILQDLKGSYDKSSLIKESLFDIVIREGEATEDE